MNREFNVGPVVALRSVMLALLLALPGTVTAQYLSARDVLTQEPIEPDFRIAYGSGSLQFGDLRLPDGGGPHPVLIVIHGGCWLSFANLGLMDRFAEDLTAAGVATWSLEYRPVDNPEGGWPNTFLDVAEGIDHLRTIEEQHNLDLTHVIVTGHSAGGHLALWAAGRHRIVRSSALYRSDPLPIAGAVSLAGVGDLEVFRPLDNSVCGGDVIDELVGGSPAEVADNYAAGSPIHLLPLGVPQRLLTGRADQAVAPQFGDAYARRATEAGDDAEAVTLEGSAHFEVIVPGSSVWPEVRRTILDLFGR